MCIFGLKADYMHVPLIADYLSVTVKVSNLRICVYGLSPGNRNQPEYQKSKSMNDICLCYQVLSCADQSVRCSTFRAQSRFSFLLGFRSIKFGG